MSRKIGTPDKFGNFAFPSHHFTIAPEQVIAPERRILAFFLLMGAEFKPKLPLHIIERRKTRKFLLSRTNYLICNYLICYGITYCGRPAYNNQQTTYNKHSSGYNKPSSTYIKPSICISTERNHLMKFAR